MLPDPLSTNTCQTSALFLVQFLAQRGVVAKIAQGDAPGKPEGYFDGWRWHGHAWVVLQDAAVDAGQGTGQSTALDTALGWILDLTADQFGGPKTAIAPYNQLHHQLHQYRAGHSDIATIAAKARRQVLVTEAMKHITPR
ncbi:hypothetical protein [Pseudophaeobacter leonis]|uniref:hypothetical protein n=1 Tax=Pseudophaeobacter leonis TaxID=1144477 RepID=UPI0009F561DC|nr:hypothetical protein [Pseudophaeobacter leonis]